MEKTSQRHRPAYRLNSVDNVLRLIQMLRDQGSFGVSEAAGELQVAPSTAHRLLSMLVYRGFAIQDDTRRYEAGPSLGAPPARLEWTRRLRDVCAPHLELLCTRVDETVNLMVRVGSQVRFLDTVESSKVLRIGDRQGAVLPARLASGGKALLAHLHPSVLERLFRDPRAALTADHLDEETFARFLAALDRVRRQGYALNDQETEEGVVALGVAIAGSSGIQHIAALSVAVPSGRFTPALRKTLVDMAAQARDDIEADLRRAGVDVPA
ncbi:MAG: IclR family transcriptional regulator [Nocardioidaceae bacterium]|nr:IclR family transcriptional regulator [Nocardioidaceae bacterium]